jgi:hypothetical protein
MQIYVIYEQDDDKTCNPKDSCLVSGLTSKKEWLENEFLRKDENGKDLRIVLEFEAETWEEAMQKYNDHYGYGKYIPMN